MTPDDIGLAYDQLTHLWESDEFNMNNGVEQHGKALQYAKKHGNALDIGCGCTGRLTKALLNSGFSVVGIDVSAKMVNIARELQPSVTFIHADICKLVLPNKYDFITAWDSIWHIPLSEQRKVITKIVDSLTVGGIFIFSFGGTEQADFHYDDSMGSKVYYSTLGVNGFLTLLIELGCSIKHMELDQYPELHAYLIAEKLPS